MIKVIELKENVARLNDSSAVLTPDKLELQIKSVGYDLSHAFITLKNGETTAKFRLTQPFKVDDRLLYAGKLLGRIDAFLDGEKTPYKTWHIAPIRIEEVETGGIKVFDEIIALEKRVKKLEDLNERIKKIEEQYKVYL